jgi:hypothetical protein
MTAEIARQGCLVIADISGYTAYLGGVELEHSHDILADLLGMVADGLCPPLRLAKLEGDAVFCVTPERPIEGATLEAALQSSYLAFARRGRTVALSSSCGCDACRRTPELDLKFCAHHGSFVEHEVAGSRELVGSDVIVVHRLLKNTVTQAHGLRGYALVTRACIDALGISGLVPHVESYDGTTIEEEIVDWRAPHHCSFRERNPAGLCLWTVSLAPLDDGSRTHIEWRIALRGGRRQALLMRVVGGRLHTALRANFDALIAHIEATAGSPAPG